MPASSRLILSTLAAVAAVVVLPSPASAQNCPTATFLLYEHAVYASSPIPASASLAPGAALGGGTMDEPTDETGCKRQRADVTVLRIADIDPGVAVAVEGRPRLIFVLGGRCAGYEGDARLDCLITPLVFQGVTYTGSRYPAAPEPTGSVPLGEALGEANFGGENVTVVRLEGVDPAVAVGIEGRPREAFVAVGACPYERFANQPERDDLLRCLQAPVWLLFDPPGVEAGQGLVAYADRALPASVAGPSISLVRLQTVADIVPENLSQAVPIGSLTTGSGGRATLPFTMPDLEQGLYEAVLTCEPCAATHGGQTVFPAGSILVFKGGGGSSVTWIVFLVGGLFIGLLGVSVLVWRKGWHRRRPAEPSA